MQHASVCPSFFFSNQMKKALSLHGCMPLMVAILKSATRQWAHAMSAPLTVGFSSLAASWTVSRMRSNLMQPHGGPRKTSQMFWRERMALKTQRLSSVTTVGAPRRPELEKSFHCHQSRLLSDV